MNRFHLLLTVLLCGPLAAWAQEQVVVVTRRDAPVEKIDAGQATQIFLKQIERWPDGTAIQPIDIKEGSPLREEFYRKVAGRSLGQVRAYWARQAFTGMGSPPRQAASAEEAARLTQSSRSAIGYVGRAQAEEALKIVLSPK